MPDLEKVLDRVVEIDREHLAEMDANLPERMHLVFLAGLFRCMQGNTIPGFLRSLMFVRLMNDNREMARKIPSDELDRGLREVLPTRQFRQWQWVQCVTRSL